MRTRSGGWQPSFRRRRDAEANAQALAKVREDKVRESGDGFDGTWVAHPDLVPVARDVFDGVLGERPNQKDRLRNDVEVTAEQLVDVQIPGAGVTDRGVRANVSVGLAYLASWLDGNGAAAINSLMEDAATAEISRSQLWQWRTHAVPLEDGAPMTAERYAAIRTDELRPLRAAMPDHRWDEAAELLDDLVLPDRFADFLTLEAYRRLEP